ncbi:MAG: hypothetical protein P8168_04460 [Deltaproteobacteria bacterium]|jgi:hypothetical protein
MANPVETTKIEAGKFWARCEKCGRWQEVSPQGQKVETYFEVWEADFCCCGRSQKAVFTLEKDYIDFH